MARQSGNEDGRWSMVVVEGEAAEVEERRAKLVAYAEVVGEEGEDRVEVSTDAGSAPGAPPGRRCGDGRLRH
jgi:hypothetical protein